MALLDPRLKLRLSVVPMLHFNCLSLPLSLICPISLIETLLCSSFCSLSMLRTLSRSAALLDDLYWPSLSPLSGPSSGSGGPVHCVLKQPEHRKGALMWGRPTSVSRAVSISVSFSISSFTSSSILSSALHCSAPIQPASCTRAVRLVNTHIFIRYPYTIGINYLFVLLL